MRYNGEYGVEKKKGVILPITKGYVKKGVIFAFDQPKKTKIFKFYFS